MKEITAKGIETRAVLEGLICAECEEPVQACDTCNMTLFKGSAIACCEEGEHLCMSCFKLKRGI